MLRRKAFDELMEWKNNPKHKSLLLKGQRQVGKTFILQEFAKTYDSHAYVDLSDDEKMASLFRSKVGVDDIITALEVRSPGLHLIPRKSLVIIDGVQVCRHARFALKKFTKDGRFDVIASGSLLDVRLDADRVDDEDAVALTPLGYEDHMRMYALDFEEFLWAKGFREETIADIKDHIRRKVPLTEVVLDAFESAFKEYIMIGGMPEAVRDYVDGAGVPQVQRDLNSIIESSREDMTKYNTGSDALKIIKCFQSIPLQLAGSNKKFMYSRLENENSRSGARMYRDALLWISGSGIGNFCYRLRDISYPVSEHVDDDQFKVYMSDTGLLIRMADKRQNNILDAVYSGDVRYNQGMLMENVVAECIVKSGYEPTYYVKRSGKDRMELDFVIDLGSEIAVIEVKSGRDRVAPSLMKTLDDPRFQRRIMFENDNIHVDDDGIEHYPLFAAAFLKDMEADARGLPDDLGTSRFDIDPASL